MQLESPEQDLAQRYIDIARKLAMRARLSLPKFYNRRICRKCNSYLIPGKNTRVRLQGSGANAHVVVSCEFCGNIKRYHYNRRNQQR